MQIGDREYSLVMGSDIEREGMFLELNAGLEPSGSPLAECFYSDVDGSFSLTTYDESTPAAALDWLRSEAQRMLPPIRSADGN
jgi:hypothetical protein